MIGKKHAALKALLATGTAFAPETYPRPEPKKAA